MTTEYKKGSLLKRTSAFLLDGIILLIVAVGFAFLLANVMGYRQHIDTYTSGIERYADKYDVKFDQIVSQEDYEALEPATKARYEAAVEAMNSDMEILGALSALIRIIITVTALSLFLGFLILEFIVPLLLKNGRTLGKKGFGLAVVKKDGSDVTVVSLILRTFVGKYLIDTMIPVLLILITIFNAIGIMNGPGIVGFAIIFIMMIANVALLFVTKSSSMIHDLVSDTVVIENETPGSVY